MKAQLIRPAYFVWIVAALFLWGAYQLIGNPYLRWSYDWRDYGQGHDALAERHYTRCTYLGFAGQFTVYPHNGRCPLMRFERDLKAVK